MWFNLSVYCVVIDVKAHLQLDGWLSKLMWGMCQIPIRYAVVMKVHYTVYMLYYRDCGQLTPQLRVGKLTASWKERSSRSSAAHVVVLPPPDRCILVKSSLQLYLHRNKLSLAVQQVAQSSRSTPSWCSQTSVQCLIYHFCWGINCYIDEAMHLLSNYTSCNIFCLQSSPLLYSLIVTPGTARSNC